MVRWVWPGRLVRGLLRYLRLFGRWLAIWIAHLTRSWSRNLRTAGRVFALLLRPRRPDNLFVSGQEATHAMAEQASGSAVAEGGTQGGSSLLYEAPIGPGQLDSPLETNSLGLWRGRRTATTADAEVGTAATNRQFAYLDLLAAPIRRLSPTDIDQLDALIARLARKWQDVDQQFAVLPRRNRLDVGKTLRHNIPRYAGRILTFQWAEKERPVSQLAKPAKILVIGDVSHSMVHYASILLYFFHRLNFRFVVESYVFSERATHSTPFLNGLGTFEEKVQRLVSGASSWNAGTRFGTALEQIADQAAVDEYTYVLIATDGKVSLQQDEPTKIERCMLALRSRAKQVIFLTPSADFSDGASGKMSPVRLGSLKYDFYDIPIFEMGPPLWYGQLGKYADRIYLVRTVQDLTDMAENLLLASKG